MSKGLNVISLGPGCGYGDAACEYVEALDSLGQNVSWNPIVANSAAPLHRKFALAMGNDSPLIQRCWRRQIECDRFLLSIPPPQLHRHWLRELPDLLPYCYVAWELEFCPADWFDALSGYQRIFVPSQFNRAALAAAGLKTKVEVIPHICRRPEPQPMAPDLGQVRRTDFLFYCVGTWTTRKAMEQTLRSFLEAFTADDPEALLIKTEPLDRIVYENLTPGERKEMPPNLGMTWWTLARILGEYRDPPRVHLLTDNLSRAEIDGIHQRGDCFLSLAHSEGWGLGAFEAQAAGNPVIITGWGGQLDYLGPDYPWLIDYEMRPTLDYPAEGYFLQEPGARWAHADSAHAASLMREVCSDPASARAITRSISAQIRDQYHPTRIGRQLAQAMDMD